MSIGSGFGPNTHRISNDLKTCRFASAGRGSCTPMSESGEIASIIGKRRIKSFGRKPHVGIVGAGLSGLRCASFLLETGKFEVTIIEGRNRIGGRVHQVQLPNGHLVDCGPNWIHGTEDNPILDIATEEKVPLKGWDENSHIYNENGDLVGQNEGERYSTMMWDIIQDAFAYSNKHSPTINSETSLFEFFQQEVQQRIPDSEPDYERKRDFILQMAEMWGAFVGNPVHTQSLKFFWLEECIEGENLFCAGTYQKILHSVAQLALEKAHFMYSTTVTRVKTTDHDGGRVQVTTSRGETFKFDEVVFTAPLGWLKKHPDTFKPELPPRLTQAINSIGYGCLEKVYISFPQAFWVNPDGRGRIVTGFSQWLSPNYALDSNQKRWNQEIVELASLPDGTGHPTLLFYIYGEQSRHITDRVTDLSAKEKDAFLFDFFRPYYSRLPHFNELAPECQPTACFSTDWLHDDMAGNGSYSNFQVGLEEGDKDIETMRQGLPDQGLWFAGEHTAPYVALGTATGAYWSGENVGQRIKATYGYGGKDDTTLADASAKS